MLPLPSAVLSPRRLLGAYLVLGCVLMLISLRPRLLTRQLKRLSRSTIARPLVSVRCVLSLVSSPSRCRPNVVRPVLTPGPVAGVKCIRLVVTMLVTCFTPPSENYGRSPRLLIPPFGRMVTLGRVLLIGCVVLILMTWTPSWWVTGHSGLLDYKECRLTIVLVLAVSPVSVGVLCLAKQVARWSFGKPFGVVCLRSILAFPSNILFKLQATGNDVSMCNGPVVLVVKEAPISLYRVMVRASRCKPKDTHLRPFPRSGMMLCVTVDRVKVTLVIRTTVVLDGTGRLKMTGVRTLYRASIAVTVIEY